MSKHENHRKDVAGRANVEDTAELLAYYDDLKKYDAGALWIHDARRVFKRS